MTREPLTTEYSDVVLGEHCSATTLIHLAPFSVLIIILSQELIHSAIFYSGDNREKSVRLNTFCTTLFTYNVKMFSRMDQFNATSPTLPGEEELKQFENFIQHWWECMTSTKIG